MQLKDRIYEALERHLFRAIDNSPASEITKKKIRECSDAAVSSIMGVYSLAAACCDGNEEALADARESGIFDGDLVILSCPEVGAAFTVHKWPSWDGPGSKRPPSQGNAAWWSEIANKLRERDANKAAQCFMCMLTDAQTESIQRAIDKVRSDDGKHTPIVLGFAYYDVEESMVAGGVFVMPAPSVLAKAREIVSKGITRH